MEQFSATALLGYMPAMYFPLPFIGVKDISPFLLVLILFFGTTLVFWFIRAVLLVRLKALSTRTSTDIDDVFIRAVSKIRHWVYMLVSFYIALLPLTLPGWLDMTTTAIVLFVVVWQAIEVAVCFIDYGAKRFLEKDEDGDGLVDPNAATASSMVTLLARIALWCLGFLFVLSNLGIEITSLIAGLGIGGIAVAFALQGILSDLFSSFSIYFDKPFRIGDFIVVGDDAGTVERIGVKTTRIRTLQGEELVIANGELTSARVQNYKRMQERRIAFTLGITYETKAEKVRKVPELIKGAVEEVEHVRFDRAHFASYGDFSLNFEVVYHVDSPDYNEYMDRQQAINLGIMDAFLAEGIEFAYPTQTVYVKK